MNLNDPHSLKFDGTPDIGRVPPRLTVDGGVDALTGEQMAAVEQAYLQFRSACRLSVAPFHTEQVTLTDGTEVFLWSLQGRDEVIVKPAGGKDRQRLPHGFVVATNWNDPLFYCRDINDGIVWAIGSDDVVQVDSVSSAVFDNQVFRAADGDYFNLPLVYNRTVKVLWDYALRDGANLSASKVSPFVLKNATGADFEFVDAHYAVDGRIKDVGGAQLYAMPDAAVILSPTAMDYPEPVGYWAGSTDAEGNEVSLSAWRYALLSPTGNVWKFRLWNERLRRIGDAAYELVERASTEFVTPWGAQTETTYELSDANLGESPESLFYLRWTSRLGKPGAYGAAGRPGGAPVGYNTNWCVGWMGVNDWADITGVETPINSLSAMRRIKTQGLGDSVTVSKVIAAPTVSAISHIDIQYRLSYPAQVYWRGGEHLKGYYNTNLMALWGITGYDPYVQPHLRIHQARTVRKDTNYDVDGAPSVIARLGWKDLNLLEGTTTGRMSGKVHENILTRSGSYNLEYAFITETIPPMGIGDSTYFAWLQANDVSAVFQADRAMYRTTDYGGTAPTTVTDTLFDNRPTNTVDYSLVSRYVIDYDHKGRFYAAIRCEVTCVGAEWEENRAMYDGYMQVKTHPTYTVRIWFESNWDDTSAQQLLAEETVTRPCYEAITVSMFSPWYWQFPAYYDRDCKVRTPPQPAPDENFMMMFENLASHQGVNTNLCCADARPDILDASEVQSKDGIEYSYQDGAAVVPHTRYVTGQLYARTFKLADIPEALWLLHALKVDTVQDNFIPEWDLERPAWYYHPGLKAALTVTHHIEVRDGVIVQWSDNIPGEVSGYPPTAADPPAANSRTIKLYRV